ncbi:MAG: hypothetical protein HY716_10555 [Planctomycetes bacterium]|nr:hypothetical protein [Planctomycetota bacterium]
MMQPALMLAVATSLGYGPAEGSALHPAEVLVAALAAEARVRSLDALDPVFTVVRSAAEASSPPGHGAPASLTLTQAEAALDPRDAVRYDWRLPVFRTKP